MGNKKKMPKAKEPIKLRIKKLANGNGSLYLDYYKNGKREYEFLKLYLVPDTAPNAKEANVETLRLANAVKAKRIVELQNNSHGFTNRASRSKVNVIDYIETQLKKRREKGGVSIANNYETLITHIEKYSGKNTTFKDVDKKYCLGFIEYLKTAPCKRQKKADKKNGKIAYIKVNTQVSYMRLLIAMINEAIIDEIMTANPFLQIKPENKPQQQQADRCYLTIEELKTLKNTPLPNDDVRNSFLFCCYSGLRFSDVKALTWNNLQKDNAGEWQINHVQKKTQKQEYLFIPQEAFEFLPKRGNAKGADNIFALTRSSDANVYLKAWAYKAELNKNISFHVSRHTYATILLSKGATIETVSKLLGHSDIQTTQIYAKIIDENKRKAVNLLNGLMD